RRCAALSSAWSRYPGCDLRPPEDLGGLRQRFSSWGWEANGSASRSRMLALLCGKGRNIFAASAGWLLLATAQRLVAIASDGEVGDGEPLIVPLADDANPIARAFQRNEVVLQNDHGGAGGPLDGTRSLLAIPLA